MLKFSEKMWMKCGHPEYVNGEELFSHYIERICSYKWRDLEEELEFNEFSLAFIVFLGFELLLLIAFFL